MLPVSECFGFRLRPVLLLVAAWMSLFIGGYRWIESEEESLLVLSEIILPKWFRWNSLTGSVERCPKCSFTKTSIRTGLTLVDGGNTPSEKPSEYGRLAGAFKCFESNLSGFVVLLRRPRCWCVKPSMGFTHVNTRFTVWTSRHDEVHAMNLLKLQVNRAPSDHHCHRTLNLRSELAMIKP